MINGIRRRILSINNVKGMISTRALIEKLKVCLKPQDGAEGWELLKQELLVLATAVALKMPMLLCSSPLSTCECKELFLVISDIMCHPHGDIFDIKDIGGERV